MALYVDPEDSGPITLPAGEFVWSLEGRIRAIDHGATLASRDEFPDYMATDALSVIAFDPASRLQGQTHLQDIGELQIVPHALLGDGQMATLYACIDPEMSGSLAPLDADNLPETLRDGARVITQLPISTLSLDRLDDLTSVDWLVLDARHDNRAVLDNSVATLRDALLIHVTIPLRPTHHGQSGLAAISQWMDAHGFGCYQLDRPARFSHLPADTELEKHQTTRTTAQEALFTPSPERLAMYGAERLNKLAFLLDAVYDIHDYSYELLKRTDATDATRYLVSRGYISAYDTEPDTFTLTAEHNPIPTTATDAPDTQQPAPPTADELHAENADDLLATGAELQSNGNLPAAAAYYRAALEARLANPSATAEAEAESTLIALNATTAKRLADHTLSELAKAGVHAFAAGDTLLGLIRDNKLPYNQNMMFGIPFGEHGRAKRCLENNGWQAQPSEHIANPQTYFYPRLKTTLELVGFVVDETTGKAYSGTWMDNTPWAWASIREWPGIALEKDLTPELQPSWALDDPAAHLDHCFGDWRALNPQLDTATADKNRCGFAWLTQCDSLIRTYDSWASGQIDQALAYIEQLIKHLPEEPLFPRVQAHLQTLTTSHGKNAQPAQNASGTAAS